MYLTRTFLRHSGPHLELSCAITCVIAASVLAGCSKKEILPTKIDPSVEAPVEAPSGNAGLFVGVNTFSKDRGLKPLSYAVDDAIAQADVLVKLGCISPHNCYLALSGDPTSADAMNNLKELQVKGVHLGSADGDTIKHSIETVTGLKDAVDLIILSFSTHGFEIPKATPLGGHIASAYLLPADATLEQLSESALPISTIVGEAKKSKARDRLLLFDACRSRERIKVPTSMPASVESEISSTRDVGILTSCSEGESSYEWPEHGFFTESLLAAFHKGGARYDDEGNLRLGAVIEYVGMETEKRALRCGDLQQHPFAPNRASASHILLLTDQRVREKLATLNPKRDVTIERLKSRIDDEVFTNDNYENICYILSNLDLTNTKEFRVLGVCNQFADGVIEADVFLPYLNERVKKWVQEVQFRGVDRDGKAGVDFYERIAKAGNADAKYDLGRIYDSGLYGVKPDHKLAVHWFELAAAAGHKESIWKMRWIYDNGYPKAGVPADAMLAIQWSEKAASAGDATAMYRLGERYDAGDGVPKDQKKAVEWFKKAAEAGSLEGMHKLAWIYDNGYPEAGVPPDDGGAVQWFQEAAKLDDAFAMYRLGERYDAGDGVPKDQKKAVEWFKKAAEAGSLEGMHKLAWIYDNGYPEAGITPDPKLAFYWFTKAAAEGDTFAKDWLRQHNPR